jgi:alkanesulfonate monooxygenase SsuD/methylene tetrahydromethanopterin reductase-like flavin-dependent oxidoreductase (luciferase family)
MFKSRVVSIGIIVSLLLTLVFSSGALAKEQNSLSETSIIDLAEQAERDGIQRAWACDGKGNIYELTPESGQIEFMDRSTSRAEFMAKHAMSSAR